MRKIKNHFSRVNEDFSNRVELSRALYPAGQQIASRPNNLENNIAHFYNACRLLEKKNRLFMSRSRERAND